MGPLLIRNNRFENSYKGVFVFGDARKVQVVGNTFWGLTERAVQLQRLFPQSSGILIANNTFFESLVAFSLWDDKITTRDVQVRNNLVLKPLGPDMVFYDSGGNPSQARGPGDAEALARSWAFDHNWRETPVPAGELLEVKGWIPPSKEDVRRENIDGVGRDPKDPATFLRPTGDSELATKGAGVTDPSLPFYVGALPPPGMEPWDWSRTWLAPPPGKLITVSKDPKDGGDKRTLQEALAAATPWTTIRVLDAETYDGPVELTEPEKHTGVVLEAPKHATIRLPAKSQTALGIRGIPDVRVRGFHFKAAGTRPGWSLISVLGSTPGVTLEGLDLTATEGGHGIILESLDNAPPARPLVVRNCSINVPREGILVIGGTEANANSATCRGLLVQDNRIFATRGVQFAAASATFR